MNCWNDELTEKNENQEKKEIMFENKGEEKKIKMTHPWGFPQCC